METFREYLKESLTITSATDLDNLFKSVKKINNDTLVMSNAARDLDSFTKKLLNWGYKQEVISNQEQTFKKKGSFIGISLSSTTDKATIIIGK
jgi:excinuclease UvrABC helicase subunit UvrB